MAVQKRVKREVAKAKKTTAEVVDLNISSLEQGGNLRSKILTTKLSSKSRVAPKAFMEKGKGVKVTVIISEHSKKLIANCDRFKTFNRTMSRKAA